MRLVKLYIFSIMLNEKTTSANNLRIESSRRHHIRNLRAKVRSMLPEQICHKESKRITKMLKFEEFLGRGERGERLTHGHQGDRRIMKELQKLSVAEIEEISENKYYFFGNQTAIQNFDQFIRENHPRLKPSEWHSPKNDKKQVLPFGFIPPFFKPSQPVFTRGNSFLFERKRGSACSSVHVLRNEVVSRQINSECRNYKERDENTLSRKQAIEEEQKVKREISLVQIQRQQHIADVNRNGLLKLKIERSKFRHTANNSSKHRNVDHKNQFEQYDVMALTAQLRKVCIKRNATKGKE